jgi:hypothetical protein
VGFAALNILNKLSGLGSPYGRKEIMYGLTRNMLIWREGR